MTSKDVKKDVNLEEFAKAGVGMSDDYISGKEFDDLISDEGSLIVIDLRGQEDRQEIGCKQVLYISIEDMVAENLEKLIPEKSTPIVLICYQSYQLTRMVALTTYAYPTLKLMGYENIKILANNILDNFVAETSNNTDNEA